MRKKNLWVVEVYDPIEDRMFFTSDPMPEARAMAELIRLDREFPNFSVSSRKCEQ